MFSSRSFIVSGLIFRSLLHFELIFLYGIRKCSSFILLQVIDRFSQHHLLKRLSFLHCIFLPPLSKIKCPSVHFSRSVSHVWLFVIQWNAARQASLSITNFQSSPKLMSIKSMMPSSHLILWRPFLLLPPSLPASGAFPMSQLFAWGGQSIGASTLASVLPKNTQDWSPLEWISWISLQSKGLSRVFSNTTVQKHQFFGAQLSL